MATPHVDLTSVHLLSEIIVRAGDATDPQARKTLQDAYLRIDPSYPDAVGASALFREGATLDELAHEGSFPHKKLSFSVINRLMMELAAIGYDLVLFMTPTLRYPDHHSLAVAQAGIVQPALPDRAADALLQALLVVDNPHREPKP